MINIKEIIGDDSSSSTHVTPLFAIDKEAKAFVSSFFDISNQNSTGHEFPIDEIFEHKWSRSFEKSLDTLEKMADQAQMNLDNGLSCEVGWDEL
ncbi:MAG: hypothetical protein HQ517_02440 [SAR324 cluster bacterium]|nr:hypothetical protein [SAR324 cluster bacterium]